MTACGGYRHNDGGRHHKIQEICYELVRIIFFIHLARLSLRVIGGHSGEEKGREINKDKQKLLPFPSCGGRADTIPRGAGRRRKRRAGASGRILLLHGRRETQSFHDRLEGHGNVGLDA
jgi:hypothetical protein|nr:MAG: hypothetical protein [Bacteriophage sp.]UVY65584.1 MAG: hypothetical protein [Bacteriophage sp.]DAY66338.1 MAG TPA: hypothetical protein [Caudoviricetes sp.]